MEVEREQEDGQKETWQRPELKPRGDLLEITRAATGPGTTDFLFADEDSN